MAEVTNELMYKALKQIQADVIGFMDAERETKGALSAIRIQMASILQNMNAYATLVNYDTEPDRTERRLETAEAGR